MRRRVIGALLVLGAMVGTTLHVPAAPAAAITVNDESSLRAAFGDPNETQIDLAGDITLDDFCPNGNVGRNSGTPLVVNGHGHSVTQTCGSGSSSVFFVINGTSLTFENITITGGQSVGGVGGGVGTGGSVSFINSTVTGNTVGGAGQGGGVFAADTVSLTNSTVSGNTATVVGGGVFARVGVTSVYSTIAGNNAPSGANIAIDSTDTLTSFGSVVALPAGGGGNCFFAQGPATVSNGYNWDDDGSCAFGAGPGDHSNGGDPLLGPLTDNGGPTQTRLPQPGSGLIDAVPTTSCQADGASGITADQRRVARPQIGGCDIGAVEVEAPAPSPIPPVLAPPVQAVARFTG
jgi:hypothetical protein